MSQVSPVTTGVAFSARREARTPDKMWAGKSQITMKYRALKGTSHNVSEVGFGVWTVGTKMWA